MRQLTAEELFEVLGKPYEPAGYGPNSFDCYGVVWFLYKEFYGKEIPMYQGFESCLDKRSKAIKDAIDSPEWKWRDIPQTGNVALLGRFGRFEHVGIVISDKHILHVSSATEFVVIETIKRLENLFESIIYLEHRDEDEH